MSKTIHWLVSGRVQGVCFRMYTQEQGRLSGLTGWVRNLPDGRVEVMASGEALQLKELETWLHKGPAMARVLKVETEEVEYEKFQGFTIK